MYDNISYNTSTFHSVMKLMVVVSIVLVCINAYAEPNTLMQHLKENW